MSNFANISETTTIINVGADLFADALEAQGASVSRVAWRPPAGKTRILTKLLADPAIDQANSVAVERMLAAHPVIIDIQPAHEAIPELRTRKLLHAGPPIAWAHMCGPMRGAIIGACLYEGWAKDEKEAVQLAESGAIDFEPCHHYNAVGPMAGSISPSMPVFVVEDKAHSNRTYCTLNEGLGKVLR